MEASKEMQAYLNQIELKLKQAYKVASAARKKGFDPEESIDIPLTKTLGQRVEGLVSAVAPQLMGSGVAKRIKELENKYGAQAIEVALKIAEEVAKQKLCKFMDKKEAMGIGIMDKKEAMEIGIRTGFAYFTVGVVAAPLEGFIELKIKKRRDGKEYLAASYAGPVRGAGGTASSVSVILADYMRRLMGYEAYDPTPDEINRFATELEDYHERVTNLQYRPSPAEIKFLMSKIPVEVDGDPTERLEVSNYKDLPRVETNRIRGGVCLVVSMFALKAPKLYNYAEKLKGFGLDWSFLKEFLEIQKRAKAGTEIKKEELAPDATFITDLVAGRPVLTYPLAPGGFRLRYGRTRISGYSAVGINPATLLVLKKYIATGTQLKLERPGKAAAATPCDTIEGPILKLEDGSVIRAFTQSAVKEFLPRVKEVLFLGDMLISYGDFFDRGHVLVPAGYCEEFYAQELEKAMVDTFGVLDTEKLASATGIPAYKIESIIKNPLKTVPDAKTTLQLSKELDIPLHPYYTYHWKLLSSQELLELVEWFSKAKIKTEGKKIILPLTESKAILETTGLPHTIVQKEFVVIQEDDAEIVSACLNLPNIEQSINTIKKNIDKNALELINLISQLKVRDKSGTFVGARMGRPEKAKMRKLTGSPHVLFPVGDQGGRLRSFQSALEKGFITADLPIFSCEGCKRKTVYSVCEVCEQKTKKLGFCSVCGDVESCKHTTASFKTQQIDISHYFESLLKKLKTKTYPDLIKGVRGTSNKDHIPENLVKGFLRAKHDIYVNKDGTTRYDMTELPITHFKPKEINTPVDKLKSLGYLSDIKAKPLENEEQTLELKPQDIILPASTESTDESADNVLFRMSKFIDELLTTLYGQKPFYKFKTKQDVIGHLVVGLAPHTSAGAVGRIIGFSRTQALFAHPLFHAAMRRDCDGDEACVMLLMDALLNFSRQYLPDKRGSRTMDAPLVLTSILIPSEVDDMVHRLDVAWNYPLELYQAAHTYKKPWDIKIDQLGSRLGTENQYQNLGFTHNINDMNSGVSCSAYKTLPSMEDKLRGQMEIAERLRAVKSSDVARLVIEKHFLKDIKGNLRRFSIQQFRCVNCNHKFRRPPLSGKCTNCGGRIIFTISEGSIIKYLEPAISLARHYEVDDYTKQSLQLLKLRVEEVFGREKEKQEGLGKWFG
jgi:DNA polymerase II large subunit